MRTAGQQDPPANCLLLRIGKDEALSGLPAGQQASSSRHAAERADTLTVEADAGGRPATGSGADGGKNPKRLLGAVRGTALRPSSARSSAALAIFGVIAFIAGWELAARGQPDYILPGPLTVAAEIGRFLDPTSDVGGAPYTSLSRVVIATALATLIGSVMVLAADEIRVLRALVHKVILPFFNSFPALGWAMLGVIWLGIGNTSVIFMETAILIPFSMVAIAAGCQAIDRDITEMALSYTRSRTRMLFRIKLPLLAPYVFTAVRTSYGVGWKVALIAEIFGASSGLGYQMDFARQNFQTPQVLAAVAVVVLFVYVVDFAIFSPAARRLPVLRSDRDRD
jgi:NitT/TauT family transport system permease protein